MSVIDIQTRRAIDDAQAEHPRADEDFASSRKRMAYRIFMGQAGELEYHLGLPFSSDVSARRCALCEGRFASVGTIYGFWHGSTFEYLHRGCRNEAEAWSK